MIRLSAVMALFVSALSAQTPRPPVVDNDYVRVIDAIEKPHAKGKPHEHKVDRVMIYVDPFDQRITTGTKVENHSWKAGDVVYVPATSTHVSENVSDKTGRILEVELKPVTGTKPVDAGPLDPVKVDPKRYKVVFENDRVRVLRVTYGPHEKGVMHEHTRDRVSVPLTPANMQMTTPDGNMTISNRAVGSAAWAGPARHQEYNAANEQFVIVAVEIKNRKI
jgi:mannose-6-phosphate isomerase-like protein (cupin superfamily)